jgi:diguanylate cyclase
MPTPRLLLLPWLILVATLGTTWFVWNHERQSARTELHSQFDFALRETVSRIEQRVAAYEQMLRGVQGLFATTDLRNRNAVRDYVETLGLDANFSGVQAIGVIERVSSSQKATHVATMHQFGFSDYSIFPEGKREIYAPIVQREPDISRSRMPIGFDAWADPMRRLAMEKARDSGMAAITGKVQLVIDKDAEPIPGFIMYLPIFARGQPRESVAQRRDHLIGWVSVSFRMRDFMASLYGTHPSGLALAIYDDITPSDAALMYRNAEAAGQHPPAGHGGLSANEYMVVAGHTWTLTLATQAEFEDRFGRDYGVVIAVTGIGLGLSMSLLAWFMITGRARALQLAAEMTEELRQMAQHDSLTGLPNRALFSDRVQRELAYARRHDGRFAMIFLDLDRFKPINDNYGHAVGDLLLQQVAGRLQDALRASDTVGRIGGDEFVVLMGDLAGPGAALALAEKIRQEVRRPYSIDGRELTISCSLGVAIYPDDGSTEVVLCGRADAAMYRAKEEGRDSVRMAA